MKPSPGHVFWAARAERRGSHGQVRFFWRRILLDWDFFYVPHGKSYEKPREMAKSPFFQVALAHHIFFCHLEGPGKLIMMNIDYMVTYWSWNYHMMTIVTIVDKGMPKSVTVGCPSIVGTFDWEAHMKAIYRNGAWISHVYIYVCVCESVEC